MIGLVGAGGTRASTCAGALWHWLGTELQTRRTDLGHPPRGLATRAAETALGLACRLDRLTGRRTPSRLSLHLDLVLRVSATRSARWMTSCISRLRPTMP